MLVLMTAITVITVIYAKTVSTMTSNWITHFQASKERRAHMVEYDPFIECHIASRNQLWGHIWCEIDHKPHRFQGSRNPPGLLSGLSLLA